MNKHCEVNCDFFIKTIKTLTCDCDFLGRSVQGGTVVLLKIQGGLGKDGEGIQ